MEAIEAFDAHRLVEQVDRLAHHAVRGEVWEKALTYSRQAGTKAFARSANYEAVACWEQALAALAHLSERRETIEQAIDVRCDLRNALLVLGEHGKTFDYLREAATLAEALGDRRRLGEVSARLAGHFWLTGDPDHAIEESRRTLDLATTLGDSALRIVSDFRLGQSYHALGDYRRAAEFLRRTVEALPGDLARERFSLAASAAIFSRTRLVGCLAELSEFAEGVEISDEAVRIAYARARSRGCDHPHAIRILAHAWLRVLWRCWHDRQPYDVTQHRAAAGLPTA